ncbi:MAG: PD40 domain-containing protein [Candidatus Eisenbacteria bacterium]|nr:PD40 domain-containing protein [Candidatus Eisenbacteria bacterium]MCC7142531.1 PD40 domain-containing protein [Candidatus Eisenbacteria bacterium]
MEGTATSYEIRYAAAAISEATWAQATQVAFPGTPQTAGRLEQLLVPDIGFGEWRFGLKSADEAGNRSLLSNVVALTVLDSIAPSQITDLRATGSTRTTVTLEWTAPGGNGSTGRASEYLIRYATEEITAANWEQATAFGSPPSPAEAGVSEQLEVDGLLSSTLYFFGIRSRDAQGNEAALSNTVSKATLSPTVVRVTSSPGPIGAYFPHWSPDGTQIAFNADWDQQFRDQLYIVSSIAPFNPTRITNLPEGALRPEWSPDGGQLAFIGLRLIDPITVRELWTMGPSPFSVPFRVASHNPDAIQFSAWSPDGQTLAYSVHTPIGLPPGPTIMYTVAAGGGAPTLLADPLGEVSGIDWSPDGSRIAIGSDRDGDYELWLFPIAGGEPVQLTDNPATDVRPSWSPDGKRVAFGSDRAGTFDIWVVSASGGEPTRVTVGAGHELDSSWSPDGKRLAYGAQENGISDIWIQDIE